MLKSTKIIRSPYEEVASLQQGNYKFDFHKCLHWLNREGQKQFGSHFSIRSEDQELIYKLLIYAIGDKECCKKKGLNLEKGILLTGPIGCGNVYQLIM